ncbi:hypothetical protein B0H14DRAFT_3099849 [Mycena olivaceomarginata]|nr:hypothetical protein B0H14DRAFT_3099849 [Mycena olivaceomarginata]
MGNNSGANGHYNGTRPPDDLSLALHEYSRTSLSLNAQLDYLLKDYNYKIGLSTLKKLNRQFKVPTVKKPPPDHIATTLVAESSMNNVSSRNGPNTFGIKFHCGMVQRFHGGDTVRHIMAEIDPDGAETRFPPGRKRQPKQRGHLTDTGVYYELHFDGHEKLNFKALRMGPVGIDIYGSRCHSSSQMVKFMAVPNAHCSSTVGHYYLDLVEKHGELYACHVVMRWATVYAGALTAGGTCLVALKSTDNIPIESSWHLFTNYVGLDLKEIILLGKSQSYFNPAFPLHIDLFNWLWPKIVQYSLDDFVDYWNNHKIRTQRNKALPSGVSPKFICDFPERFGLTHFGTPAPQDLIDTLHQNIPKSREECYRWVSDEFEVRVSEIYDHIEAPKLAPTEGWTIFCQMLPHF